MSTGLNNSFVCICLFYPIIPNRTEKLFKKFIFFKEKNTLFSLNLHLFYKTLKTKTILLFVK